MRGRWDAKNSHWDYGKILGRGYSIEEPFEDPHTPTGKNKNSNGSVHSIGIPVRPKPYPRKVLNLSF